MKRLAIGIVLMISVCGLSWAGESKLNILTTTSDLKSITEEIGGKYVDVKSICTGDQDPHFAEARPSLIASARKADLFVKIGLELEVGYEYPLLEGARNTKIKPGADGYLDVSQDIRVLEVPTTKVDRSMGDVHPFGNPHYWLDPYNARIMAQNISNRLQKLDPAHSAEYQANYQTFVRRIDEAMFGVEALTKIAGDKLWEAELAGKLDDLIKEQQVKLGGWIEKTKPLRGIKIVMFHRSWIYFLHRFGIISVGELEPKPGICPGPGHLKGLINTVKTENVKVILMETFYDRKPSDFVAGQTGAKVVIAPLSVGGEKEAKDYISLMDILINKLLEAVK